MRSQGGKWPSGPMMKRASSRIGTSPLAATPGSEDCKTRVRMHPSACSRVIEASVTSMTCRPHGWITPLISGSPQGHGLNVTLGLAVGFPFLLAVFDPHAPPHVPPTLTSCPVPVSASRCFCLHDGCDPFFVLFEPRMEPNCEVRSASSERTRISTTTSAPVPERNARPRTFDEQTEVDSDPDIGHRQFRNPY
jgi:hypothetical protein